MVVVVVCCYCCCCCCCCNCCRCCSGGIEHCKNRSSDSLPHSMPTQIANKCLDRKRSTARFVCFHSKPKSPIRAARTRQIDHWLRWPPIYLFDHCLWTRPHSNCTHAHRSLWNGFNVKTAHTLRAPSLKTEQCRTRSSMLTTDEWTNKFVKYEAKIFDLFANIIFIDNAHDLSSITKITRDKIHSQRRAKLSDTRKKENTCACWATRILFLLCSSAPTAAGSAALRCRCFVWTNAQTHLASVYMACMRDISPWNDASSHVWDVYAVHVCSRCSVNSKSIEPHSADFRRGEKMNRKNATSKQFKERREANTNEIATEHTKQWAKCLVDSKHEIIGYCNCRVFCACVLCAQQFCAQLCARRNRWGWFSLLYSFPWYYRCFCVGFVYMCTQSNRFT